MLRSLWLVGLLAGLGLLAPASAQLVAPPDLDWFSLPSTATVGQPVAVSAGAHANASDNSDGNDWNDGRMVIAFILIELQRPGESGWTTLCQWLDPWTTPGSIGGSFTPTSPGTHYVRVRVMDGRPWFSPQYTYAIAAATPSPAITSSLTLASWQGFNASYTITATGSPTSFGATNLPSGLSINPSTGVISGRVIAGSSTVNSTITATNAAGTDSKTLTWSITGAVITPTASISPGTVAIGSSVTLTRAGTANFGIGWTQNTIWRPNGSAEALGNQQLGSQTYTPTAGTGTYSYQFRIVDSSGYNYVDQWTTFSVTSLPAPAGLQATSIQSFSATLGWNALTGATGYNVYRNGVKLNSSAIAGTSYTDSGLQPGTTYSYIVRAIASDNSESLPATLTVTTAATFELFTPL